MNCLSLVCEIHVVPFLIIMNSFYSQRYLRYLCWLMIGVIGLTVYKLEYDYVTQRVFRREASCYFNESHKNIIERYYAKRMTWKTSNLGSILFKNAPRQLFVHPAREDKNFVVLIWKHWNWMKTRHIKNYGEIEISPLNHCSVKNCIFTGNDKLINKVDAVAADLPLGSALPKINLTYMTDQWTARRTPRRVVIHTQKGIFPNVTKRNINQRWILLNDESPIHLFSLSKKAPSLGDLANIGFNWTMTYRSDSDVPVPYGRTVPLPNPLIPEEEYENVFLPDIIPHWATKKHDVLAAVLTSNCVPYRMKFLEELKKYMPVDVYGACSTDAKIALNCPGHYGDPCKPLSQYLFYLVLENSRCRQYITEKIFYHAYTQGAIPVIMGPPLEDCEKLLPPKSFIHVDHFHTVEELATHLKSVRQDYLALREYHRWRNHFEAVNEHGYFGEKSYHYCRVCEALNYNDGEISVYDEDDIKLFFDKNITCVT